ncbi:hypothetical protein ACP70R_038099 [Stipagrostis hirtigluma subsp. patula]
MGGSPHGSVSGGDSPAPSGAGDTGRGPMISGALMARIARATRGNIDLVRKLEVLIDDLGEDIRARHREDPPGDMADLADRYLELCDVHLAVFRSFNSLSAYLDAFQKELADLAAAAAAGRTVECDRDRSVDALSSHLDAVDKELADLATAATTAAESSVGGTVDHDQHEADGRPRSRI